MQASCTISEARSLGSTALIVAHELAHNLGADHDGLAENRWVGMVMVMVMVENMLSINSIIPIL